MLKLNFKKWMEDINSGMPPPVQDPIKLGLYRALPTYEVPNEDTPLKTKVAKFQKKKQKKMKKY